MKNGKNTKRQPGSEAQKLIEKIGRGDLEISHDLLCSAQTVMRWRRGESNPRPGDLERLRRLASEKRV